MEEGPRAGGRVPEEVVDVGDASEEAAKAGYEGLRGRGGARKRDPSDWGGGGVEEEESRGGSGGDASTGAGGERQYEGRGEEGYPGRGGLTESAPERTPETWHRTLQPQPATPTRPEPQGRLPPPPPGYPAFGDTAAPPAAAPAIHWLHGRSSVPPAPRWVRADDDGESDSVTPDCGWKCVPRCGVE